MSDLPGAGAVCPLELRRFEQRSRRLGSLLSQVDALLGLLATALSCSDALLLDGLRARIQAVAARGSSRCAAS